MDMILDYMDAVEKDSGSDPVEGYFVTGYPRDIVQAQAFEEKVDS